MICHTINLISAVPFARRPPRAVPGLLVPGAIETCLRAIVKMPVVPSHLRGGRRQSVRKLTEVSAAMRASFNLSGDATEDGRRQRIHAQGRNYPAGVTNASD